MSPPSSFCQRAAANIAARVASGVMLAFVKYWARMSPKTAFSPGVSGMTGRSRAPYLEVPSCSRMCTSPSTAWIRETEPVRPPMLRSSALFSNTSRWSRAPSAPSRLGISSAAR
jgi:hypothetical protein